MRAVFVHGWSVTNTSTYGGLPAALVKNAPAKLDLQITHLYLGKYVSFADEVKVDDIARGMQHAIATEVLPKLARGERFACITHSTGGPVVRAWIDLFHRGALKKCPIGHLIMLAPANHGSALAQLGKGRLSQMKFFAGGVEPGRGVLDWLELGSDQGWELNREWLGYNCVAGGLYPFVLTGQKIDRAFYDNLNSYTDEAGSDGVVRVAAASLNYGLIRLVQHGSNLRISKEDRSATTALGVLPGLSHSGTDIGILGSVDAEDDRSHPTVHWVLRCMEVGSVTAYRRVVREMKDLTANTQQDERVETERKLFVFNRRFVTNRYCMLVIRLVDDRGNSLSDYDVLFTAGPTYDPNHLPPGFFVDRQRNQLNRGKLTYYIDYDVMREWLDRPELGGKFGVQITARPAKGFAYYTVAEHRGTFAALRRYFEPNQTVMVEVELRRHVAEGVFRLTQDLAPEDFKKQPKGADLP
ncbi:MAG: phospholipase [Acidobacteria bacterium]|nr:phospholipase [Acidobacteriota bacterium]